MSIQQYNRATNVWAELQKKTSSTVRKLGIIWNRAYVSLLGHQSRFFVDTTVKFQLVSSQIAPKTRLQSLKGYSGERCTTCSINSGLGSRLLNPFSTAVPFWGQTSQIRSNLSPKRDCGTKRVNDGGITSHNIVLDLAAVSPPPHFDCYGGP